MPTKAELIRENERLWTLLLALANAQHPQPAPAKPVDLNALKTATARKANAAAFGFSGGKFDPQQAALDLIALRAANNDTTDFPTRPCRQCGAMNRPQYKGTCNDGHTRSLSWPRFSR